MHNPRHLLLLLCILCVSACEYDIQQAYVLDLEKPTSAPEIALDIGIPDTDTVFVYWDPRVTVNIVSDSVRLLGVKVILGGDTLHASPGEEGFSFLLTMRDSPTQDLKLEFITSSGSNSMLDCIGQERFHYYSRQWVVVFEGPSFYNPGSYSSTDGGLMVEWRPYDGVDFDHYLIVKTADLTEFQTLIPQIVDTDYIGEVGRYNVFVIDREGEEHLWAKVNKPSHNLNLRIGELDGSVALVWDTPSEYLDKIDHFELFKGKSDSFHEHLASVDVNQTAIKIEGIEFFEKYYFGIRFIPRKITETTQIDSYCNWKSLSVAIPSFTFDEVYGTSEEGWILEEDDSVFYYNTSTGKLDYLIEEKFNLVTSLDNQLIAVAEDETIDVFNVPEMNKLLSLDIKTLVPSYYINHHLSISDNGILGLAGRGYLLVYDIFNNRILFQKELADKQAVLLFSAGGKYLIECWPEERIIYEFVNDEYIQIEREVGVGANARIFDFIPVPGQAELLYTEEDESIEFRSFRDLSIKRSCNYGTGMLQNVDFVGGRILTYDNPSYFIYNIYSGQLIQSFRTYALLKGYLCGDAVLYSGYKNYLKSNK